MADKTAAKRMARWRQRQKSKIADLEAQVASIATPTPARPSQDLRLRWKRVAKSRFECFYKGWSVEVARGHGRDPHNYETFVETWIVEVRRERNQPIVLLGQETRHSRQISLTTIPGDASAEQAKRVAQGELARVMDIWPADEG